jgi:DNA-binding MarR family transcriptional regulator
VPRDVVDRIQEAWRRERPGMPVQSIGVLTRIRLLAKLLEDDHRRVMAGLGVDPATRDLLSALRRVGPPYRAAPNELARATLVSAGAISQRVARAEREGLVRRRRSDEDGRGVLVELTSAGHEVIERTVDALLAHERELLRALDFEQQGQLATLLRELLVDLASR